MIPFAQYLPDLKDLNNPGTTAVKNVIPDVDSYREFPALSTFSNALDAYCRGAIAVKDKDANVVNYAGDAGKLYALADDTFSDVSLGGGYSTASGESWEFLKWGEKVLATNYTDNPQTIAIKGANFANLTTAVKFRHFAAVREFVVAAATNDGTDGELPSRVRWSALNDETDWTVSPSTQADFTDLKGRQGWCQAVRGGEYGVVFQEYSIWRMTYVGSPIVFQFDETQPGYGTPSPHSVVQWGDVIYFLGQDGFYALVNGLELRSIGANRVDRTFFNDLDPSEVLRVVGTVDPINRLIIWAYPGSSHTSGRPNKLLIYNYAADRWGMAEVTVHYIYNAYGQGYSLEGLDAISASIDALSESLDSRAYKAGSVLVGGFGSGHMLGFFSGAALDAELETAEIQISPGQRSLIRSIRPLIDGNAPSSVPTITVQVGTRQRQQDAYAWTDPVAINGTGECPVRSDARYHRARVKISGGFDAAIGVEAMGAPAGAR